MTDLIRNGERLRSVRAKLNATLRPYESRADFEAARIPDAVTLVHVIVGSEIYQCIRNVSGDWVDGLGQKWSAAVLNSISSDLFEELRDQAVSAGNAAETARTAAEAARDDVLSALDFSIEQAMIWLTATPRADGLVRRIAGRGTFETKAGATAIGDLPGWVPHGVVTPEHFGVVNGVNDQVQINAAITYVDANGGGEVWCLGQYIVANSGTWATGNGDLNAAVRLETTNAVMLRGIRGISRITLTGTKISHVVILGRRVGATIISRGGVDGVDIVGNLDTAVSEGVPFEGGHGIVITGPGEGVRITNLKVSKTWNYGIGGQRNHFKDCVIDGVIIEDTGNDGIDCKFDLPGDYSADVGGDPAEGGNPNNWIRNVRVTRPALRYAALAGQKAGIDVRVGWNVENASVELDVPAVGLRTQHDAEASTVDSEIRWQSKYSNVEVYCTGVRTGTDGNGDPIDARSYQFGTYRPIATNLSGTGAAFNFWVRSVAGVFTNLIGRAATKVNLAVYGSTDGMGAENKFFGGEMIGADQQDIRVYGAAGGEPSDTGFFGLKAGVVQVDAGVSRTEFFGCEIATLTDSGTDTLRIKAGVPAYFKAGRNETQYVEITGDGLANYIRGISQAGSPKPLVIESLLNDLTLVATDGALELAYRDGSGNIVNVLTLPKSDGRLRLLSLPTSAPATANTIWRDAATGQLRITPP